jgi:hypothetical protein
VRSQRWWSRANGDFSPKEDHDAGRRPSLPVDDGFVAARALVVECMMRSLDLIEAKKLPDFDIQPLKSDVAAIARE